MDHLPFILRLVAATVIRRQQRFLHLENEMLRAQLRYLLDRYPNERRIFLPSWKRRFATLGAELGWKRLKDIMMIASVSSVRQWFYRMRKGRLSKPSVKVGRPRITRKIEKLIVRLATENPEWGYLRIQGTLRSQLDIRVGRSTIAEVLKRNGIQPIDPQRQTRESTWKQFIDTKMYEIAAADFFTVDVWSWSGWGIGKRTIYVLFAIHLSSRRVEILGTTEHPDAAFMEQAARSATMDEVGWLKKVGARYFIHDHDTKFCDSFKGVLQRSGVEPIKLPPQSPNLNAFAERWVRTVKYECLKKLTILGYGGLNRALKEFLHHYHHHRPHQSLGNRPPESPIRKHKTLPTGGRIRSVTSCQGVLRHYYRSAA